MIELTLAHLLAAIVTDFGNTELNYISDFKTPGIMHGKKTILDYYNLLFLTEQSNLLAELAIRDITVWQYELSALRKRQEEEFLPQVCPIFETRYPKNIKLSHCTLLKVSMTTSSNFAVLLKNSL